MIEAAKRVIDRTRQHWEQTMERREVIDLFGEVPKAPRAPTVLRMHVVDAGDGCEAVEHGMPVMARFACHRCHGVTDWLYVTYSEAKRGIPCEKCNGEKNA